MGAPMSLSPSSDSFSGGHSSSGAANTPTQPPFQMSIPPNRGGAKLLTHCFSPVCRSSATTASDSGMGGPVFWLLVPTYRSPRRASMVGTDQTLPPDGP